MKHQLALVGLLAVLSGCTQAADQERWRGVSESMNSLSANSYAQARRGPACYRQSDCLGGTVCAVDSRMNQTAGHCVAGVR
jgi:outer membrane lipoprotein-sorting protein